MVDMIPPVVLADAEDVIWALQTADTLWKRGERIDAIVWVRRAAQAAGDANDTDRALVLAQKAADLTEAMAETDVSARRTISDHPEAQAEIDDLLSSAPNEPLYYTPAPPPDPSDASDPAAHVEPDYEDEEDADVVTSAPHMPVSRPPSERLEASTNPGATEPPIALATLPPLSMDELDVLSIPPGAPVASAAPPPPPSSALRAPPPPLPPSGNRIPAPPPLPRSSGSMPVSKPLPLTRHAPPPRFTAGRTASASAMPASPPQAAAPAPLAAPPRSSSAQQAAPAAGDRVSVSAPRPPAPSSSSVSRAKSTPDPVEAAPSSGRASSPSHLPPQRPPTKSAPGGFPVPVPRAGPPPLSPIAAPAPAHAHAPVSRPAPAPLPPAALPPPPRRSERLLDIEPAPPPSLRAVAHAPMATMPDTSPPPAPPSAPPPPSLDLGTFPAFALLADQPALLDDLSRSAKVHTLAPNDEVVGFGLALVLRGQVNVAATVAEAPALRSGVGELVRSGGTAIDQVKIRLVPVGEDVEVACWSDEDVARVLESSPALAAKLGELADHIQVRVGVALGPLGERLDFALRTEIVDRLETRHLKEGEVVVLNGKPVPGMIVVGAGSLELVDGEISRMQDVNPGEFLFAEAILGGGPAPHTARAGKGGATILFGGRLLAQELLVTCPPLLELFAGM